MCPIFYGFVLTDFVKYDKIIWRAPILYGPIGLFNFGCLSSNCFDLNYYIEETLLARGYFLKEFVKKYACMYHVLPLE